MKSKAIIFSGVNQTDLIEFELPSLGEDQILIETKASCVSPGTELRCLAGKEGATGPFPFIPGYAPAGVVIAAGNKAKFAVGDKVISNGIRSAPGISCKWGGHSQYVVTSSDDALPIPNGLDFESAAISIVMAIPMRGILLAQPQKGETVSIIGLGLIGNLSARIFAALGTDVMAFDLSEERVKAARAAGIKAYVIENNSLIETAKKYRPEGADIAVDCTGVPQITEQSLELCRELSWEATTEKGPRFIVQGTYGADVKFPYGAAFARELTIYFPRDRRKSDMADALQFLTEKKGVISESDTAKFKPEEHVKAYELLRTGKLSALTAVFQW